MVDTDDTEVSGEAECGDSISGFNWASLGGVRRLSAAFLLLGGLILLFWNEGNSKRQADAILEASRQAQTVSATLDPALDGKPVHVSATVESAGGVLDPVFGVRSTGVALYRDVYMFQWIELAETTGRRGNRRTTYQYVQDWSDVWHDSSKFHEPQGHENPPMPFESEAFIAPDARLGPYRFDHQDVLWQAIFDYGNNESAGTLGDWAKPVEKLPALSPAMKGKGWFQVDPDEYYRGNPDVEEVEIGDVLVTYYEFRPGYPLTMIGAQRGEQLERWTASNGDELLLAAGGTHTASGLGRIAAAHNDSDLHVYRIVGLICAVLGGAGVAAWFGGLLTAIPVVGRFVHHSVMVAGGILGLMAGVLTIMIGWLVARPWVAMLLLLGVGGALAYLVMRQRRADATQRTKARGLEAAQQVRQRLLAARAGTNEPATPGPEAPLTANPSGQKPPPPPPPRPSARIPPAPSGSSPSPQEQSHAPAPAAKSAPTIASPSSSPARPSSTPHPLPFETVPFRHNDVQAEAAPPSPTATPAHPTAPPKPAQATAQPALATVASAPASAKPDAMPTPVSANAPAGSPTLKRVPIGNKGPYRVNKIVKITADSEQLVCFELMKDGKPVQRGTQAEIKAALQKALAVE